MQKYRAILSFIVSISLHIILVAVILFGFYQVNKKPKKEKVLSLKTVKIKKKIPQKKVIKKPKPKHKPKSKPKPKPKPKQKPKPKPKPRHKPKKIIKKRVTKHKIQKPPKPIKPKKFTQAKDINLTKKVAPKIVRLSKPQIIKPKPMPPEPTKPIVDIKQQFIDINLQKITKAINEEKYYPKIARKRHIEGIVTVKFLLSKDGTVTIKEVKTSKRYIGKAAQKAIKKAAPYFPKPPKDILFSIPIEFKLE